MRLEVDALGLGDAAVLGELAAGEVQLVLWWMEAERTRCQTRKGYPEVDMSVEVQLVLGWERHIGSRVDTISDSKRWGGFVWYPEVEGRHDISAAGEVQLVL